MTMEPRLIPSEDRVDWGRGDMGTPLHPLQNNKTQKAENVFQCVFWLQLPRFALINSRTPTYDGLSTEDNTEREINKKCGRS